MIKRLLIVGVVAAMGIAAVQASAFARASADRQQSQQGIEQEMLRRLAFQPRDLTAQLELIRIYLDTNRLAEAEQLLARALSVVREQRAQAIETAAAATPATGGSPMRVGQLGIREPRIVSKVPPVYPVEAQAARVEGIVIIEAVIDVNGTVREARVLRSQPLLDAAAVNAVRQWQFTPTLLNGVPVEVIMTVTVNFTLK